MAVTTGILRERFYAAVGRFTVMWASMEAGLDILAISATPPNSEQRRKTPHQLGDKTKYIRKHVLPQLPTEHSSQLTSILDRIDRLSDRRHDVIHGAGLNEKRDGAALVVTFGSLLQPRKKPRRMPVKVTAKQIDEMSARVFEVWGDLLDFAETTLKKRR